MSLLGPWFAIPLLLAGAFVLYSLFSLYRNVALAKSSGLPYVIVPFFPMGIPWILLGSILGPVFLSLPSSWTTKWLPVLLVDRAWHNGYEPFELVGADVFIAAAPGGCLLFSCDAAANQQICRDGYFGKALDLTKILNVFGPTLTASDGHEGRLYRKTAAPFFTESNMRKIWTTSVQGSEHLVRVLTSREKSYAKLREILTKYTLCLLSDLAFEVKPDYAKELTFEEQIPPGHQISYSEAIIQASDNLLTYFTTPLEKLESKDQKAFVARRELLQYVEELKVKKERQIKERKVGSRVESASLLDLIVRAHLDTAEYSAEAVVGNFFILNFAGFESSANSIAFMLSILACRPPLQRAVQKDLDRILGDVNVEDWSYEKHFSSLLNSHVGAVLFEVLRLYTVVPWIPRATLPAKAPIPLSLNSSTYHLPPGMMCLLSTSATHRNPKYWEPSLKPQREKARISAGPEKGEQRPFPISDFNPDRWLVDKDGSTSILTPEAGTFLAFSDGSRACLGRRFALIEVIAVVATLLKFYNIELDVAPETSITEANAHADWLLSGGVQFGHSLRVTRSVPVKFIKR